MAEQTFKSAGFFDFETEIARESKPATGVPMAVIGSAEAGPAFVPTYIGLNDDESAGTLANWQAVFGRLSPDEFGPYAVKAWFDGGQKAVQYVRLLGAGANQTSTHFSNTKSNGIVHNAGFVIHHPKPDETYRNPYIPETSANNAAYSTSDHVFTAGSCPGTVYFISALHYVSSYADQGYPVLTDNDSFAGVSEGSASAADDYVNMIRAMLFTTTGSMVHITDYHDSAHLGIGLVPSANDFKSGSASNQNTNNTANNGLGLFKMVVSSSKGQYFGNDDGRAGYKVFTCSLDPDSEYYVSKVLNTDPLQMDAQQHMLYMDWPITSAVAKVANTGSKAYTLLSGSANTTNNGLSGATGVNTWQSTFGRFDTRYTTPRTTSFISQPYGSSEYDLFYFETIADGAVANTLYKISIDQIKASKDPNDPYGTFDVLVRKFDDFDGSERQILERYRGCNLNPDSKNFIGKLIGNRRRLYNFDAAVGKRRFINDGGFDNKSQRIRVVINESVMKGNVPASALPFGFRGIPALRTSPSTRDLSSPTVAEGSDSGAAPDYIRLSQYAGRIHSTGLADADLGITGVNNVAPGMQVGTETANPGATGSIVPPLPLTFKIAKGGGLKASPAYIGEPGETTETDTGLYWGVQFRNVRKLDSTAMKPWEDDSNNGHVSQNGIIRSYAKFQGIQKLDTLYTGSAADTFNNNKFTLAKVALNSTLTAAGKLNLGLSTTSVRNHMKMAAYIRNGQVSGDDYTISDKISSNDRVTLATILGRDKSTFNKFSGYAKFTNIFYGGFDGVNIFNKNAMKFNDRATSTETGGLAATTITAGLGLTGSDNGTLMGSGVNNNAIHSYRTAIDILNDRYTGIHSVLSLPGIREPLVTDYANKTAKDFEMAINIMDVPNYDKDGDRIFLDQSARPDVDQTITRINRRNLDSNYAAAYFPDVVIVDDHNLNAVKNIKAPASVAAVKALATSDTSRGGSPWFAPAGFNRGALTGFVVNTNSRLKTSDRDDLYEAKINPIANFPNEDYVVWGQKTLQRSASSLDRVNVRRMLLEVKRVILGIARRLLFKRNNAALRQQFISQLSPRLSFIQANQGIEKFKIIMDDTNNTEEDKRNYRLNGRILVVPTRTIEFVSMEFIVDPDGVTFK